MFKLVLGLALAVGGCSGGDSCNLDTVCSPNSPNHYQLCNGGSADDCYYITGDGHRFHCLTCGDCSEAQSLVGSWCAAQPAMTSSNLSCTTATCPSGGRSYSFCSSGGATQCLYKTNDGGEINCNSCSDCSSAASAVASWCAGSSSSTTADSSCLAQATSACQTCCGSLHSDGASYYADSYITCGCSYCATDCNTSGDVCHGGSTQTSACAACLNNAVQQNCASQLQSDCLANSACHAYFTCVAGC